MIAASSNHRLRTILIIAASLLVIGGIAAGTILTLRHFTPVKMTENSPESPSVRSPLEKANELFAKGDYTGAKSAYENIRQTYQTQNNEAGVKDMEAQLQILEATAKSPKDPVNTDKGRVIMGGQAQ